MSAAPRPAAPPSPTPPTGSPAELVRWEIGVLNSHDVAALHPIWAPDIRARFPVRTARGREAVAEFFLALFAAVPDAALTIESLAENAGEEGADVFVRWRLTGHHTGAEWEGVAASGARLDIDGMDQFHVVDGRITSVFVVFDQMQFARQIGLLPADGSRLDVGLKRAFNVLTRRRRD